MQEFNTCTFEGLNFRIEFDSDHVCILDDEYREVSKSPIYYNEAESFHTLTSYIRDAMKELDIDFDEYHYFTTWLHEDYVHELEKIYERGVNHGTNS